MILWNPSSVSGFLGYIYPADVCPHPPSGHPPVGFFSPTQFCHLADSWIPQTPEMSELNFLTMKQDVLVLTRTSKPILTHYSMLKIVNFQTLLWRFLASWLVLRYIA